MKSETNMKPPAMRDFADFLNDLDHGEVNQLLTERLRDLVSAVDETGKTGTLTLKLKLKQEGKMAVVVADVSVKKPEKDTAGTMFFFDENQGLTREDPRQLRLKRIIDVPPTARAIHSDLED